MKIDELKKALTDLAGDAAAEIIVEDAPMAEYTSFRAGGKARLMVSPRDAEQLKDMLRVLSESGCRYMIFGNGSNILVKDSGYDGVMVRIGKGLDNIRREGENLICGSGALMSAVARAALEESLTGFEFASGIPGSIGGAVFMNVDGTVIRRLTGADGGDMAVNASNHFHRVGIVNIGHDRIGGQQGKFAERCLQILHGFEKFQVICIHIQNDG